MGFEIDAELVNADWIKKTWDLPLEREEFERWWAGRAMTAAGFRDLPAYSAADRPEWVDEVISAGEEGPEE